MLTSRYWLISLLVGNALGGAVFMDSPTWAGDRFVQDRFVISFWVDPPFDANAEQRYREIAEAHFTMVLGGFGASPEAVTQLLTLCEKYNLKALVPTFNKPASEFPDGPACWGYGVQDEPSAKDFPALKQKVDEIRKARPGKLAYINLFPNYVDVKRVETSSQRGVCLAVHQGGGSGCLEYGLLPPIQT